MSDEETADLVPLAERNALAMAPSAKVEVPDYLKDEPAREGVNMRKQDIEFPRMKLYQKGTDGVGEKAGFLMGQMRNHLDVDDILIAGPGEEHKIDVFVILHFLSWIEWSPEEGKGMIAASMDPRSRLAARAEAGERNEKDKQAVTEYHNFLVVLPGRPETPFLLSFSKTSYKSGKRLLNLALAREAPIWSGRYTIWTESKKEGDHAWAEILVENSVNGVKPDGSDGGGFATPLEAKVLKALYQHYAPLMQQNRFDVASGVDDGAQTTAVVASTSTEPEDGEY